jgi:lysine-specific demethylase 3
MHGNECENGEATVRSGEGIVPKHKPCHPKGSKSKKTLAGTNQGLLG